MAKEKKEKPKKPRATKYDPPLGVNGSFLDIIQASMKHANEHSAKKKP